MNWWQWESTGGSDPDKKYDIKVVVYRGIPENQVELLFPIEPANKKDYRYLEYGKSIKYLTANILELSAYNEPWASSLSSSLETTKNNIINKLRQQN